LQHRKHISLVRRITPYLAAILMSLIVYSSGIAQISIQPVRWEIPVVIPSPQGSNSWFPDLAVDSMGKVHIVWCETLSGEDGDQESIYYSMWNGSQWSQYIDIASPTTEIRRNSLTIDHNDILHLSYIDSRPNKPYRLGYSSVKTSEAFSAGKWTPITYLNERGLSYFNKLLSYQDTLHLFYEDTGNEGEADMYYRHSLDGGDTWDVPISLLPTAKGSSRPNATVNSEGDLYLAWDEGWDRLTGNGTPEYGLFTVSRDMGETWKEPVEIRYPNSANMQLTVQTNGQEGIMLVWRTVSSTYPGVYYMWSKDDGETWSQPGTLSSFMARPVINYFDSFDMATDSAGHIHLLASGFLTSTEGRIGNTSGLYHFEWDGQRWYPATQVYNGGLIPEYPRLVIDRGNTLHSTWFVRHDAFNSEYMHEIMYAKGISAAPEVEHQLVLQKDDVFVEMIGQIEKIGADVPAEIESRPPALTLEQAPYVSSRSLYTEADEMRVILLGLAPVVLIISAIIIIVRRRQRF
jgi:hypothetical protein